MKQKTITITLQPVNPDEQPLEVQLPLAYCFATEIAYRDLTDEDITTFMKDAIVAINEQRMPDIKKTISAILAAIIAYSKATKTEMPIEDKDLMYRTTSEDIGLALGTVIGLRIDFYHVPTGEPEDKTEKQKGKKRKNS